MRNNLICGTTGTRARSKRRAIEKRVFSHQLQPIAFSPSGCAPAAAVAAGTRQPKKTGGRNTDVRSRKSVDYKFKITGRLRKPVALWHFLREVYHSGTSVTSLCTFLLLNFLARVFVDIEIQLNAIFTCFSSMCRLFLRFRCYRCFACKNVSVFQQRVQK